MFEASYEAPRITELGTITELTQGSTIVTPDDGTLGAAPAGSV